ncbi:MAG: TIM barrel protein [Nanoarchaeota archaeon]
MIRIGPAGSSGLGNFEGLNKAFGLGLKAFECQFTYGVRMSKIEALDIGTLAKKLGIQLSCHAPYYINLASIEPKKIIASKERILDSCKMANFLGAKYVVFHAGFYQKRSSEEIYDLIKSEILDMQNKLSENKWNVELAPEVTGKPSQFGSLDELLQLRKDTGCNLCVDFAHIKARSGGYIDYDQIFTKLKKLNYIHSHFSGIEWTDKGERRHLLLDSDDIIVLLRHILKYKVNITIINESPDTFGDAVKILNLL